MNDLQAYLNSYPVVIGNSRVVALGSIQEVMKVTDDVYVRTSYNEQIRLPNTDVDKVLEQWESAFNVATSKYLLQKG